MSSVAVAAVVLVVQALPFRSGMALVEPSRGAESVRCPHVGTRAGGPLCLVLSPEALKASSLWRFIVKSPGSPAWCQALLHSY